MFTYLLLFILATILPTKLLWDYFKNPINSLPGPRFYQIKPSDFTKCPSDLILEWINQFGNTFCWKLVAHKSVIVTIDPELVKLMFSQNYKSIEKMDVGLQDITGGHGLLANEDYSEDDMEHQKQRRLFRSKLNRCAVNKLVPEFQIVIDRLVQRWHKELEESDDNQITIDLKYEFTRLTMEVLCELLLDYEVDTIHNDIIATDLYNTLIKYFNTFSNYNIIGYQYIGKAIRYLPIPNTYHYWTSRYKLSSLVSRIMYNYIKHTDKPNKLIDLIMDSNLKNIEVFDSIMTFLLAGHETTASCLSWTLYELCNNPDLCKRINESKFIDHLIKESLRLHPPVPLIARKTLKELNVKGNIIPSGTEIIISTLGAHTNPDYWDNPLDFNPDRWDNLKINPYIYMPFLSGPRSCLGKSFALTELKLALNSLLTEFNFELPEGSIITDKVDFTSKPEGLIVNITKRN